MVVYNGGTAVAKGWYWSPMDGGRVDMRDSGILPGDKTCSYLKMSPLILLVIAPLFGMAFTFFLPLFGIGVLFILCLLPALGVFSAVTTTALRVCGGIIGRRATAGKQVSFGNLRPSKVSFNLRPSPVSFTGVVRKKKSVRKAN
jgi:hypothetical protein